MAAPWPEDPRNLLCFREQWLSLCQQYLRYFRDRQRIYSSLNVSSASSGECPRVICLAHSAQLCYLTVAFHLWSHNASINLFLSLGCASSAAHDGTYLYNYFWHLGIILRGKPSLSRTGCVGEEEGGQPLPFPFDEQVWWGRGEGKLDKVLCFLSSSFLIFKKFLDKSSHFLLSLWKWLVFVA